MAHNYDPKGYQLWRLRTVGACSYNCWEWFPMTDEFQDILHEMGARISFPYNLVIFKDAADITAFKLQNGIGMA